MKISSSAPDPDDQPGNKIGDAILKFIGHIPSTSETLSENPTDRARFIANLAAAKAATAAGAMALPPGPLAWITILPELIAVWKIQTQMVADLAGLYGKTAFLSQSQMIYCLFRHGAAMAVRDIVVRVGDRYLVKRVTQRALQNVAKKIGIRVTQKAAAKGISRWIPVIGALGVGGYAYYDTAQVAKTAIEMFESKLEIEPESKADGGAGDS
jgi:hypothetical protein